MTKNTYIAKSPCNKLLVENHRLNTSGSVRVIIRVRPPTKREVSFLNNRNVVKIIDEQTIVFDPTEEEDIFYYHGVRQQNRDILKRVNKNMHFTFDKIFGFESTNVSVFENSVKCLIGTLMDGYNCTIFAYGATGSGKTHTMLGKENNNGLMFLTMIELFHQIEMLSSERNFIVDVTYLEIYNENIRDLLNPETILCLREHKKYGVMVTGLQVHNIENISKLFELLERGNSNRSQHHTDSNAESSRSHAVFQVYLKMVFKTAAVETTRIAKLSMIDLAGSERGTATGCSLPIFKEGANINKSLLALGNCINSLAEGKKHIPYRDSKLTRLLKDSLGGNCQTVMVANVSPSFLNYEETYNTLKYALRATKIKLKLKKNVIHPEGTFRYYMELVDKLSKENIQLKQALSKPCTCKKVEDENSEDTKLQLLEIKDFYDEKQKLLKALLPVESTEKLLTLKQQFKKEQNIAIDMMCNNQTEKSITLYFKTILKKMEDKSSVLRKQLTNLNHQTEEIEIKISQSLNDVPELRNYADKEDLQISCIKSQYKVKHLESVCELQTQEIDVRNRLIKQFSEFISRFAQLQPHGIVTSNLFKNYQQLESFLCDLPNDKPTIEEKSALLEVSLKRDVKCYKRKHPDQLSRNNTFVITSAKVDNDYPEKLSKKGTPISAKPNQILSLHLENNRGDIK